MYPNSPNNFRLYCVACRRNYFVRERRKIKYPETFNMATAWLNSQPMSESISSSSWIPEDTKDDILNFDTKGLEGQTAFIKERMLIDSPKSIWDPQKKLKVK